MHKEIEALSQYKVMKYMQLVMAHESELTSGMSALYQQGFKLCTESSQFWKCKTHPIFH